MRCYFVPLAALTAVFLLPPASLKAAQPPPPVLLIVNDADPTSVTFTGTLNAPENSTSAYIFLEGFDLLNFFGSTSTLFAGEAIAPSTLSTSTGRAVYDSDSGDDDSTGGGSFLDLNIYSTSQSFTDTETFNTSSPAFNGGTVAFNLSGSSLPSPGATGTLVAGSYGDGSTVPLGTYEVLGAPEPSTYAMLGLGLAGLMFFARRKLA